MKKISIEESRKLLPYLRKEKEFNIFIIGDIENAPDDADYIDVYIDGDLFHPGGILLRYFDYFIIYTHNKMNYEQAAKIIKDYGKSKVLSGKETCINEIKPFIEDMIEEENRMYFTVLKKLQFKHYDYKIKKLTVENAYKVTNLLDNIDEFNARDNESFVSGIKNGSARSYYMEIDGEIVSTASTSAEAGDSAMIVAVATDRKYRNKGYATAVMSKLCSDLVKEGKTPFLFYSNPFAGKIYERIGFRNIGIWKMLRFNN
ncbi:MAG: GNAT family N-acetyltransferase [Kosmotogaceae bacterium]